MELSIEMVIPRTGLTSGRAEAIVAEEIKGETERALARVQGAVVPRTPVGVSENLRRAWTTELTGTVVDLRGRVFNNMPYVIPVELGSAPHWPPRGPIELWVRRKLGVADKDVRGVAFVIARAISQRGTKAVRMAQNGWDAVKGQVVLGYELALVRIRSRLEGSE